MDTDAGLQKMADDITSRLFGKDAVVWDMTLDEMMISIDDLGESGDQYIDQVRQPFVSPARERVRAS